MHPSLFLLQLTLILPLSSASLPPLHLSNFHLHHRKSAAAPPREFIQVSRPLPFDSLTPSCTLPLLSHTFSNASGHRPITATYSAPTNCSWSKSVLDFSASSNGSRHCGRVGAVWLSAAELLRTTTPDPTSGGAFWNFRKDVTRYASLLRRSNLTLSLILQNLTHHPHPESCHVNITFLYYDVNTTTTTTDDSVKSPLSLLRPDQKPLELDENPADLIVPINGDSDLWFKIEQESDSLLQEIKIPPNTYRAVIEIHVSFHDRDEFWYANPPDDYLETNNLPMQRGHGSFREILVKIDDDMVGSVIPFPVISNGGIDPLFWDPLVSIGAFDLPSYELELTPFLGLLLPQNNDHDQHFLKLEVADALPFWLVDANLHLWLHGDGERVQAGPVQYSDPSSCLERESKFHQLDGKFKVGEERKSEVTAWVSSGAGNFTTHVYSKVEFESKVAVKHNGTKMSVKQEVKVVERVKVMSDSGNPVAEVSRERKYPLRLAATAVAGSEKDTYLISAELEQSLKEVKKESGGARSKSENRQKCRGWMFVRGCEIMSGAAATEQSYQAEDGRGCYARRVLAEDGAIKNDTHSDLCAKAAPY